MTRTRSPATAGRTLRAWAWVGVGVCLVPSLPVESSAREEGAAIETGASESGVGERAVETAAEQAEEAIVPAVQTEGEPAAFPPVVAYVPPSRGRARQTAGAGTRSNASGERVAVLAPPDHVAFTTRAQPTLYWFVSEDTTTRIDLTLVDEDEIDPLLEITVPGPVTAGIHGLALSEVGVVLEPARTYRWYVTLVRDAERRSNDSVAGGAIERTQLSPDLERTLASTRFDYAPLALSGIWYDAIDELLLALAERPEDERLRVQRAALLEQAELSEVALFVLDGEAGIAGRAASGGAR